MLAHARALLTSRPEGACDYIDADMRFPDDILKAATRTLDLTRPVALLLIGVLGHISDYGTARAVVRGLLDALPPGSYLALADSARVGDAHIAAAESYAETGAVPYQLRSAAEIAGFFDGLDLLPPGIVPVPEWRPDPAPCPAVHVDTLGGVARKPGDP